MLLCSAFILIPSFLSTSGVYKNHGFAFKPIYNPIYLLSQLFNGDSADNVPAVFVALFFFIMFFFFKEIDIKARIFVFIQFIFLCLSTWIDFFYLIWHSFTWPNGFPQRESFVIVFFIGIISYVAMCKSVSTKRNTVVAIQALILEVIVLTGLKITIDFSIKRFFLIILFNAFLILLCWLAQKSERHKYFFQILLFFVAIIDMSFNALRIQNMQVKESMNYSAYAKFIHSSSKMVANLQSEDKSFYRIGNSFQASENDPLLFNYNGVSNYLSQQSTQLTNFMSASGYYQNHSFARWSNYNNGSTLAMDRIFGIKYILGNSSDSLRRQLLEINKYMSADNNENLGGRSVFKKNGSYFLLKDKYTFPIAFKVDDLANNISVKYSPNKSAFTVQNKIWTGISGDARKLLTSQQVSKVNSRNYNFVASKTGYAYIYFPTIRNQDYKPFKIICNNMSVGTVFDGNGENGQGENGVVSLGYLRKGEPVSLNLKYSNDKNINRKVITKMPYISIENEKLFKDTRNRIVTDGHINYISKKGNNFIIRTDNKFKNGNILLTIPYENGWVAYVNGVKTDIKPSIGTLMSVKVPDGVNKITFKYQVPGLLIGLMFSVIGFLIIFILFFTKGILKRKILKKPTEY